MKKMVLIDGTNLLYRSYYATAVTGRLMRNSKGMPTNALFGFINMLNKIIEEEQADYYVVALDEGKTFRHEMFDDYKGHRSATPDELKVQIPYAKPIMDGLGIKWLTAQNYEADDIVGSLAHQYKGEMEIVAVSSDQDYLQLVDNNVTVKLLKKSDAIYYNCDKLKEDYGLTPSQIIDLKSLEGDKSDNIPGVAGVGAKTAIKLIAEYGDLEGIYNNIDKIKGKLQEKLISDKESAFFSKELVTLHTDLRYSLDEINVDYDEDKLRTIYKDLEFSSFIKKLGSTNKKEIEFTYENDLSKVIKNDSFVYFDFFGESDHDLELLGISVKNDLGCFYIKASDLDVEQLFEYNIRTFDYKKSFYYFYNLYQKELKCDFDFNLAFYLLDKRGKELSEFASIYEFSYEIDSDEVIYGKGAKYAVAEEAVISRSSILKVMFMEEMFAKVANELQIMELDKLFNEIEMPLSRVISLVEYNGISVDKQFLVDMSFELDLKINEIASRVYEMVGYEFNISSYKQLGKALFEDLEIKYPKRIKEGTSYKTSVDILEMIVDESEVVALVLEYRTLSKLKSTYLDGLQTHIKSDGKIHTIFTQTLTTTGRLSSIEPNLQNIPIRTDIGREIRKAFIASDDNVLVACDYSQIELRILAQLSSNTTLIDAFNSGEDIHTKTASDVFEVPIEMVNDDMRRKAKAINFGIIYGMSEYGLSKNIDVNVFEAKEFIAKYFNMYSGVKKYLDQIISDATIHGYSRTLFNRIRYIDELKSNNQMQRQIGERLAMNTPIQGSAADIIKIAMIRIDREFKKNNIQSKMVLQVHDELIFDCKKDELDKVIEIVSNEMRESHSINNIQNNFDVELNVSVGQGLNWYQAK